MSNDVGKEIKFSRTVIGSSSEYRIDGKLSNATDYQNELEKLGIYLKAKNFLVYQGQVESIAIKNAKEIALVFEEISRLVFNLNSFFFYIFLMLSNVNISICKTSIVLDQ
jgi:chromosome segregation ATPase